MIKYCLSLNWKYVYIMNISYNVAKMDMNSDSMHQHDEVLYMEVRNENNN